MVQNLRDGVTPLGSRLGRSLIGTKVWSGPYLIGWVVLCDEVTLWVETVLGLILDCNEEFSDFLFRWFRAFAMGSPFRVEFAKWAYTLDRIEGLFLNYIPRLVRPQSFRVGSPF